MMGEALAHDHNVPRSLEVLPYRGKEKGTPEVYVVRGSFRERQGMPTQFKFGTIRNTKSADLKFALSHRTV